MSANWMDVSTLAAGGSAEGDPGRPASRFAPIPDLLDGLNDPQRAACTHESGPLLILAGPGSGKTRAITHRIVWLLTERGVAPQEVLAITFTNKAAREMRERVEKMLPDAKGLWISTFHSMCARLLRREIEVLGEWTRDFSIYDTSDRNLLLKRIVKDLNYDAKRFRPGAIGAWISDLKNTVKADTTPTDEEHIEGEVFERVRKKYEEELRTQNALDFDDLLIRVVEIFEEHPGIRDSYARRFRFVLVDEYQDTNRIQYLLTRHLASAHGNLAVCGDPDQSIYGWRGADIRNILDFEKDYPDAKTVVLEQNYRSKGTILKAADAVIAHNVDRKPKSLWTEAGDGEPIALLACSDENEEAREIAAQIRTIATRGGTYSDVAILYRANFMQRALETALRLSGVQYQIVGGLEFYSRREIRDAIAYLRLAVNPADAVAVRRVINVPMRGIGDTSLTKLSQWADARGVSLLDACRSDEAVGTLRGRAKKGVVEFRGVVEGIVGLREAGAAVALDLVLDGIGRDRWLGEMDEGDGVADREANVEELRAHAAEYDRLHPDGGLRGFLEDIALVSETDGMEEEVEKVTLMTLHACKGLEFPHVFIAGVEDELLPHIRAMMDTADPDRAIEEERRLFYVGLTRARERVYLTRAMTRLHFGETRWAQPSRFLDEVPPELIEGGEVERDERDVIGEYEEPESGPGFSVGELVEHDHFGVGRLTDLVGSGPNARATVEFTHHGTKALLLLYAKLRRVDA